MSARPTSTSSRPSVAGVGGGVGASTVAVLLGTTDSGVFTGRPVDVLACHDTGESLGRAGHAAQLITADGHRPPVVAVTATSAGASRLISARLDLLAPHTLRVIVLPYVRRWREITTPMTEVRRTAHDPGTTLPRALRRYGAAARDLQHAVHLATGLTVPRAAAVVGSRRPVSRIVGRKPER